MPDILVSEAIFGSEIEILKQRFEVVWEPNLWRSPERLNALIPQFRALIVRSQTQVTSELIQAGTQLKVIGRAGVGLDNIDLAAAGAAGIAVVYTPDQNSNAVAELTLGLMLSLARRIPEANRYTRSGGWEREDFVGVELSGKSLGIIGFGRIGQRLAHKAKALGMEIVAYDPYIPSESSVVRELNATLLSLDELLSNADFISCHLPKTEETQHLLNYDRFCLMKATAFFLNTARGSVIDEAGLVRALQEKRLAGAALDVREEEPPSTISPLAALENVILTPHIGAFTHEAQERVVTTVCQDVAAVLNGKQPRYPVKWG